MKLRTLALIGTAVVILLGSLAAWRWGDRVPVIELATHLHASRGNVDCGHVTLSNNSVNLAPQAAIECARAASARHLPYTVIFTTPGIDEKISNAIIGDSRGNAIELIYATGWIERPYRLLKFRCNTPVQLQLHDDSRRLHCAPFPPDHLDRDFIFW